MLASSTSFIDKAKEIKDLALGPAARELRNIPRSKLYEKLERQ